MDSVSAVWILVSAALVLFMVPGLALFYGGMSRSKNMLNMLMMNMKVDIMTSLAKRDTIYTEQKFFHTLK